LKYLLDTDICIYLIKNKYPHLRIKIEQEIPEYIGISAVSVAELEYGVAKSKFPEHNKIQLLKFLSPFELVPFTGDDSENFGVIRTYLHKMGMPIGPYDLQIAAQCITRNLVLITNNVREFKRVPLLKIENWVGEN
jgi:tRNA(fMet)-specific endonuclease VapC